MKNFYLFIDSISRFQSKQLYYWIINKYIKKVLPQKKIDVSSKFDSNKESLSQIIEKAIKLFRFKDSLIFNLNISEIENHHNYYNEIIQFIEKDSDKNAFNNLETDDDEIINNYHRFFLFSEVYAEKNIPFEKRIKIIINWIDTIPFSNKKAWTGFNATIRLLNWLKIFMNFDPNYKFNNDDETKILSSFLQNLYFVKKHIEYHIPGNHIIFQFYVLWLFSNLFKSWKDSETINYFAEKKIINEFNEEFLDNGFHFEQSYHYHIQITLLGLYWKYNLKQLNRKIEEKIDNKLNLAVSLSKKFVLGEKTLPMLADNCFTFFHENIELDFNNLQILASVLYKDIEKQNDFFDIQDQYVIFNKFNRKIIIDVGNIGLACNPGHGHSDIFSILYSVKDQPIFIDPGTRRYSNSKEDLLLKKAVSHNTLSINGEDQAKLWGFFRWAYLPKKIEYKINEKENTITFNGKLSAFRHIGSYYHNREVLLKQNEIEINDHVFENKFDSIIITFILHPSINCSIGKSIKLLNEKNVNIVEIKIDSEFNYKTELEEFYIYPNYNYPIKSSKLSIIFNNSIAKDFNSKILVKDFND